MTVQYVFKRYETKYLLSDEQRDSLMALMDGRMADDPYGPSTVRSIYFDTPDYLLARRSIDGMAYKEKIRLRSYGTPTETSPVFFELKKKCKGVSYKRRTATTFPRALAFARGEVEPEGQIERELLYSVERYEGLRPAMLVSYEREAYFACGDETFRMTFDRHIRYRTHDVERLADGLDIGLMRPRTSLLEVKSPGALPLWLVGWLTEQRLRKVSFSKYGMAYRHELGAGRVRVGRRMPARHLAYGIA
jgi:SPX domain protein involved in polyphosphate accumulation